MEGTGGVQSAAGDSGGSVLIQRSSGDFSRHIKYLRRTQHREERGSAPLFSPSRIFMDVFSMVWRLR